MVNVKDNFVEQSLFNKFKQIIFSSDFSWYYKEEMTKEDSFFFNHCFYVDYKIQSHFFNPFIKPILDQMNAVMIDEVRANLLVRTGKRYKSKYHCDRPFKCKTAILYMNTCDGYTEFYKGDKILSVENRLIVFNSDQKHRAVSQLNTNERVVINFNFIENKQEHDFLLDE